jgi:hypothetical protein
MTYVHEFDDGDEEGFYEIEVEAFMDGSEIDTNVLEIRFISHYAAHQDVVLTFEEFLTWNDSKRAAAALDIAEARAIEKFMEESPEAYDEHMDEVRRGR